MTPSEIIQDAEHKLKRTILYSIESSDIQQLANNFTEETGLLVKDIEIEFADTTTIDGTKGSVVISIRVGREEA